MDSVIKDTPSISWNGSRSNHPARIASYRALDAITCADKEGYISLYAPDGVIHDPVGMTAVDPTGAGHRGHDAISAFWDATIARAGRAELHRAQVTRDPRSGRKLVHDHPAGSMRVRRNRLHLHLPGQRRRLARLCRGLLGHPRGAGASELVGHAAAVSQQYFATTTSREVIVSHGRFFQWLAARDARSHRCPMTNPA
jgi:hypothetical protein